MFEAWKARRAEEKRMRAAREAEARAQKARAELMARRSEIENELSFAQQRLERARTFSGVTGRDVPDGVTIALKKGESVFCVVTTAVLVEPRKGPGKWKGGSQGISMPIPGTRLRYRVGASRGQFEQGTEAPTPIDEGTFVVTSQRAVFTGEKQSREWQWSKLLGVSAHDGGWTALAVSNRQKVSGIAIGPENQDALDFWIDLAVAHFNDTVADLVDECVHDVEQLTAVLTGIDAPTTPSAPGGASAPASLPPTT